MAGLKKLVIVESPAKAKTIGKYLGDDFEVHASVGHIRDLIEPKNLPPELKKGSLGKFSVDVEGGFEPYYVVSEAKKRTVAELKKALSHASELYLATDGDREGEAIAWHLLQVLKPHVPVHRMVFHEITRDAIREAEQNTRDIDEALVDAQETRRILDRLYGYEVSPVLWRKVGPGLSAGRVQSAATRLVVERERERRAFVAAQYWDITANFRDSDDAAPFETKLVSYNAAKTATGRDFDDKGTLKSSVHVLTEAEATALADQLTDEDLTGTVLSVETKPYTRRPAAPFTTSTLQQEAGRKLKFTARQTMSVAQSLYENGYITYMRTDSPTLSQQAVTAARGFAREKYGAEFVPDKPRQYAGKAKNAQEAHEAIRPSGDTFRSPTELAKVLSPTELKLYKLIWKRTVASQMADATGSTVTVRIGTAPTSTGTVAEFATSGTTIAFRGFLKAYEEGNDDEDAATSSVADELPNLAQGDVLAIASAEAAGHSTNPPARYTEASLVKELEELGIGRPSTYAAIISTIIDRGYVELKGQALVPTWTAFAVIKLLENHFGNLVDYAFTAEMESDLDHIATGEEDRTAWLSGFYFGDDDRQGLRSVIENLGEIDAREINSVPLTDDITLRIGRYGPYLEVAQPDQDKPRRVGVPTELAPDELTAERAQEIADAPEVENRVLGVNPATGREVVAKDGRFGPYVTEVLPEGEEWPKGTKAPTASLFKTMDPVTVGLEQAIQLLNLPRHVGDDPETGEPITAQNGRFGPYLKKGADTRSLPNEDAIFSVTLDEAVALYAQPKYGARAASSALKEFDADPVSGKPIKVKDGRFGPYVTDGVTNVTIPKGETPDDITFERAVEMLAIKRAKGPAKRPARAAAKKAPAKKPAAKKPAAKSASGTTAKTGTASTASKSTASKTASSKTASSKTAAKKPPASKTASKAATKTAPADPATTSAASGE